MTILAYDLNFYSRFHYPGATYETTDSTRQLAS